MKKYLYIIFLFFSNFCLGQVNLVSNPSFEDISSCPTNSSQLYRAIGWNIPINGGGGNPEIYHTCCTQPAVCGVPSQTLLHTFQYPHSGNSYAGIDAYYSFSPNNSREYIQSELIKGLSAGHIYCVKFYASLSDQCQAYLKPLGAYFDDGSVSALAPHGLALVTPQVYNTLQPLNDTINWMKIEGTFTAIGTEEYITIGNFFTDSNSDIGIFVSATAWFSYYYIDDVSVIDASLPAFAGNDTIIQSGDSIFIGRQPEIGLDEDCIWFVNGLPIDTIAGMWVQPDSSTTYILEQTICGNVSWDTVTVTVDTLTGLNSIGGYNIFNIYPNPATNTINIEFGVSSAALTITDVLGNEILKQQETSKNFVIDISFLAKGLYFIKLTTDEEIIVKKFLKE